jgi:hypothetical protein
LLLIGEYAIIFIMENMDSFERQMADREDIENEGDIERGFISLDERIPKWARYLPPDSTIMDMIRAEQNVPTNHVYDEGRGIHLSDLAGIKIDLIKQFDIGHRMSGEEQIENALIEQASGMQDVLSGSDIIGEEISNELQGYIDQVYDAYVDYYVSIGVIRPSY